MTDRFDFRNAGFLEYNVVCCASAWPSFPRDQGETSNHELRPTESGQPPTNSPFPLNSGTDLREIQRVAKELATTLTDLNYNNKEVILSSLLPAISEEFDRLHPDAQTKVPVPPEILELANREFSESEVLAALREIRESGGLTFNDFYPELEKLVEPQT